MTRKIELLTVIVCEEDYKYCLFDWDEKSTTEKVQIIDDANNPDESFCFMQEWIGDDFSLYKNLNENVGREWVIMTRVLIHDYSITREGIDAMWADLRKRIQESDEPIKVAGIIGILSQVEGERLRKESIQESEALGDA